MEPDPTFFVWGNAQGEVSLAHAPCGQDLISTAVSIEAPALLTAIANHVCPGV